MCTLVPVLVPCMISDMCHISHMRSFISQHTFWLPCWKLKVETSKGIPYDPRWDALFHPPRRFTWFHFPDIHCGCHVWNVHHDIVAVCFEEMIGAVPYEEYWALDEEWWYNKSSRRSVVFFCRAQSITYPESKGGAHKTTFQQHHNSSSTLCNEASPDRSTICIPFEQSSPCQPCHQSCHPQWQVFAKCLRQNFLNPWNTLLHSWWQGSMQNAR